MKTCVYNFSLIAFFRRSGTNYRILHITSNNVTTLHGIHYLH
jgi:hypothetical protein